MENNKIIIDCEKRIDLTNYSFINNVDVTINNYQNDNNVIIGNVLLNVSYNYENELFTKEELIPFELSILNNKEIINLNIENIKFYEIVNQGVQCSFQIAAFEVEKVKNFTSSEEKNELTDEKELMIEEKYEKILDDLLINNNDTIILEEDVNINKEKNDELNDIQTEAILNTTTINNNDLQKDMSEENDVLYEKEEIKETIDISKEYPNKENNIKLDCKNKDLEKVRLSNINDTFSKISVYYPKSEQEIDKVCVMENVSISTIYNNKLNKDFSKKKRIIIDK